MKTIPDPEIDLNRGQITFTFWNPSRGKNWLESDHILHVKERQFLRALFSILPLFSEPELIGPMPSDLSLLMEEVKLVTKGGNPSPYVEMDFTITEGMNYGEKIYHFEFPHGKSLSHVPWNIIVVPVEIFLAAVLARWRKEKTLCLFRMFPECKDPRWRKKSKSIWRKTCREVKAIFESQQQPRSAA